MILFTKRTVGFLGERAAAKFLKKEGFRIVGRNVREGRNEIDVIAKNKENLLFVEVKSRSFENAEDADLVRPSAAVDAGKRQRTRDAALAYLSRHPTSLCPRLDVVEVWFLRGRKKPLRILHVPCAFNARGNKR